MDRVDQALDARCRRSRTEVGATRLRRVETTEVVTLKIEGLVRNVSDVRLLLIDRQSEFYEGPRNLD